MKLSLSEQIAEVGREIGMRKGVYPKWVASGKLTQAVADRQIACMEAAYATLKWLLAHETQIKHMLKEQTT